MVDDTTTDRAPRSADSREKSSRKKPWQPPSLLDAPTPPPGYVYRWLRESMVGVEDKANMSKRIRVGFEPVRADEHPEFDSPTVDDGRHAGTIGVGGLVLAKVPEETVEERTQYFKQRSEEQIQGVDNDLLRDSDPRMPISKRDIQRNSKVEFGSRDVSSD